MASAGLVQTNGLGSAIVLVDVAADGVLEVGDGREDAASDAPSGDDGEEVFDGVEPGARGGREMEHPARVMGQPPMTLGCLWVA